MRFAQMTAPEIGETDRRCLVVVPVGSTEQHGPHLPVDTDTRLVTAVAEALEGQEDILLAPTLWLGHSPHHLSFGGTLSAGHQLAAQNLAAIGRCFAGMGFGRLLFLNGHGGNNLPLAMALQALKEEAPALRCWSASYWQLATDEIQKLRQSPPGGMGHAGELETSLYMHLAPEGVRTRLIADAGRLDENPYLQNEMFLSARAQEVRNFSEFTPTGVFGAPSCASPQKGDAFFKAILAALAAFVRALPG